MVALLIGARGTLSARSEEILSFACDARSLIVSSGENLRGSILLFLERRYLREDREVR